MKIRNHRAQGMFVAAIIILLSACNLPSDLRTVPKAATKKPVTQIPRAVTSTRPVSSPTKIKTPIFSQTPKPTPTRIPNTVVPTLPNFDPIINFGGGGGGTDCVYPDTPNTINVTWEPFFNNQLRLCVLLQSYKPRQPLQITSNQLDGGSETLKSHNFSLNQNKDVVLWDGYAENQAYMDTRTTDGAVLLDIAIWWPGSLQAGKWRFAVTQGKSSLAIGDFIFQKNNGVPSINALNPNGDREIMPASLSHYVKLMNDGNINLAGMDFPSHALVYILLYQDVTIPAHQYEYKLIRKQAVVSDAQGAIYIELPGPFQVNQSYLVYGITDPNVRLGGGVQGICSDAPCDFFNVISPAPTVNSCPNAPPQRMVLNQRGYVCTKSDPVRLRSQPQRSAGTLMKITPGTQFEILGGPACADDWSWWKVKLDDGTTGWFSEGGDDVDPYFICPLP